MYKKPIKTREMKKLVLTVALAVSNIAFTQNNQPADSDIDEVVNDIVYEVNKWSNTTKTFKTGDNDKSIFIGLLKNIYTDTTVKYVYAQKNPRIGDMQINGYQFGDTISYTNWISSIKYYDSKTHKIKYNIVESSPVNKKETLFIESVCIYTMDDDYISGILIYYNGNNLRSFVDSTIK